MDLSIIIPYYNSGLYIEDALKSVTRYSGSVSFEIILIDDGSTDSYSIEILKDLKKKYDFRVFHQKNKGAAAARNLGVQNSFGKYLLFLDSDNKIKSDYIEKAIIILNKNKEIGIVYSSAIFFGETHVRETFKSKPFKIEALLKKNFIDMCSFVRKEVWESVSGFDTAKELLIGEDWDFWISAYEKGWKFYYIKENLFYYRVRNNSLVNENLNSQFIISRNNYIFKKHIELFWKTYNRIYEINAKWVSAEPMSLRKRLKRIYFIIRYGY